MIDRIDRWSYFNEVTLCSRAHTGRVGTALQDSRFTVVIQSENKLALLLFRHKASQPILKSLLSLISLQAFSGSILLPVTLKRMFYLVFCLFAVSLRFYRRRRKIYLASGRRRIDVDIAPGSSALMHRIGDASWTLETSFRLPYDSIRAARSETPRVLINMRNIEEILPFLIRNNSFWEILSLLPRECAVMRTVWAFSARNYDEKGREKEKDKLVFLELKPRHAVSCVQERISREKGAFYLAKSEGGLLTCR